MPGYIAFIILLGMLLGFIPSNLLAAINVDEALNAAELQRTSDPDEARRLLAETDFNSLSKQQQHQFIFINAYLVAIKGELNQAVAIASTIADSPYTDSKIKANLLLANMYESIKNYQYAYSHLYLALSEANKVTDKMLISSVYTVATQLHISAGAYDKAINYAQLIRQASAEPRALCISWTLELHAKIRLEQTYNNEHAAQVRHYCLSAKEPLMTHSLEQFTAEIDIKNKPALVKTTMLAMLPDLERIGFPYAILRARYFLGYAQLRLGEVTAAVTELQQVQLLAAKLSDSLSENEALLLLAQAYETQGNTLAAVKAYKQHISKLNTHVNEFKQRSVAYHMAQADFKENENKLALLKSQNSLLQLESELQKEDKLKSILFSIALTFLLLLVIYALNNKRATLNQLATTDFLTKLYNRRYFSETVSRQLKNRRQQDDYSLIMFDIDLFKQINDQYGHATGDKVLQAIAERCSQYIRKQDILARIGGEEFAIFLPGCNLADALKLAEQCRLSISNDAITVNEHTITVSASFGVASSSTANFDSILQQADAALYHAKTAGRNCSHVSKESA
ncbi:GGDEF domain-containing protein [Rheinheimera sp. MMS21-TC3]|uniref:GGDEF domain-containing protein n=1 Tax=Rheinheimera sp. MMS21-TC3 TaxID=3072790 RepID=UPI0028C3A6A4|nr:GGDEF domain-containing protein [Rheinheimera sp. MMS21-TC3]WNO59552.1 GGDEF domain-containing protein [Rheinheimera sp. MMS21-TC3]